jgi:steroid delta-isomerase-like uncharacterized protein
MTGSSAQPDATPVELVRAYLQAWNDHDGPAVVATLVEGGTYVDPTLPAPIGGQVLADYVAGLAAAFPDLRFDVGQLTAEGDRVVAQWRMHGTKHRPAARRAPTDRRNLRSAGCRRDQRGAWRDRERRRLLRPEDVRGAARPIGMPSMQVMNCCRRTRVSPMAAIARAGRAGRRRAAPPGSAAR